MRRHASKTVASASATELEAPGFWTAETRDAIRRFEENRGLPVTGRISEAFLTELIQIGGLSLN